MLNDLPDDVLIYTIAFLSVPDILHLRQTCKGFETLTRLSIVWTNAFKHDILSNDYPCNLDETCLEQRTCHAYRLATDWLGDRLLTPKSDTIFTGSPVTEIKLIPGRRHKWLLAVLTGTGSQVLTIWDITRKDKCSEWSQEGARYRTVKLNTDPESEASIAVSLLQKVVLLHLDDNGILHEMNTIDINLYPVALSGDIIALNNPPSKMLIYNWKTGAYAYLDEGGDLWRNPCLEVVLTPSIILVVRTFSISIYASPLLLHGQTHIPIATHSFDWVIGVSVPSPAPNNPLSILICSEEYNPHAMIPRSLELYSLSSFTPILGLTSKIFSDCPQFILGKRATAVCARKWENSEDYSRKSLIAAVFPGPLNPTDHVRVREVCTFSKQWCALDYDEDLGRIAFQSGSEQITILQL
ncbi:hypothetical protein ARMGADRAFT_1169268 [Armillaria gallica]|uniref:F-box domain-containing protein n=1 Tax=Armillaria gallica TaxID=47427 RepID=A0A2H3CW23_ARMGA|nr:hypothetical protein ARMGADRAFT_1169268 [Armillaria gallica]